MWDPTKNTSNFVAAGNDYKIDHNPKEKFSYVIGRTIQNLLGKAARNPVKATVIMGILALMGIILAKAMGHGAAFDTLKKLVVEHKLDSALVAGGAGLGALGYWYGRRPIVIEGIYEENFPEACFALESEQKSLPEGWQRYTAKKEIHVVVVNPSFYTIIPIGANYFTYQGKIVLGIEGYYEPPCPELPPKVIPIISGEALFDHLERQKVPEEQPD